MELNKKLPLSFFEKTRKNVSKKSLNDVKPFKWSNEKETLNGKKKDR